MVRQQGRYGKASAIAVALMLALGGFALTGCGGTGDTAATTASDEAVEEQTTDAEVAKPEDAQTDEEEDKDESDDKDEEEELQQWYQSKRRETLINVVPNWEGDGTREAKSGMVYTFTRDERGNVMKSVGRSIDDDSGYHYRVVRKYTRDEQGWPLSEKCVETTYNATDGSADDGEKVRYEYTYEYERDDEGRVVVGTRVCDTNDEHDDGRPQRYELSYDDEGNIASITRVNTYAYSDAYVETETETNEYAANGKVVKNVRVIARDGVEIERIETTFDEDENNLTRTVVHPQEDGDDLTTTWTYENEKNDRGKVVKATVMGQGDGVNEYRRFANDSTTWMSEVVQPDGSVQRTTMGYDDEFNEVAVDEPQSFGPGPYLVKELTYDADDNVTKKVYTFYDDTTETEEYTYDADGNMTSSVLTDWSGYTSTQRYSYDEHGNQVRNTSRQGGDEVGSWRSSTRTEWTYIEDPSDFIRIAWKYDLWWD